MDNMFFKSKCSLEEENKKLKQQIEDLELRYKRESELREQTIKINERDLYSNKCDMQYLKKDIEITRNYINVLLQRIAEIVGAAQDED